MNCEHLIGVAEEVVMEGMASDDGKFAVIKSELIYRLYEAVYDATALSSQPPTGSPNADQGDHTP